jgi:hypothetical protein
VRYTTLRVTEEGVILYEAHAARLAPEGGAARARFDAFAAGAASGVYALLDDGERLDVRPRAGSSLVDGMPVRLATSPVAGLRGPIPKPPPPGPYAGVRAAGIATLLASPDGSELWESCVAAIVGFDGRHLVVVPDDRPRVASLAEAAVRRAFPHRVEPILAGGDLPLLLVNAVKGACLVAAPGHGPFPDPLARDVDALIVATARRP